MAANLLVLALAVGAGCSYVPPRAPGYPPSNGGGGPGSGSGGGSTGGGAGNGNAGGNPHPTPAPPSATTPSAAGLTLTPLAIHCQASRPLAPLVDAAPTGFTFEARIESSASTPSAAALPFAVDPILRISEARDDRGRDLAPFGPSAQITSPPSAVTGMESGPRWITAPPPQSRSTAANISWRCYGMDSLPRSLARLRGTATAYVVGESQQRDVGVAAGATARGPSQLLPGLTLTVKTSQRTEASTTIETSLERTAPYSGDSTDVPRIIKATLLDQRGAEIAQAPVLGASMLPPRAGQRAYPLTLTFFTGSASQKPTTLRLLIATRLDRVEIPFSYDNLPVADAR